MGFYIIQPHATTNLDTNPSFELATTGWTLNLSATIARDTTVAKRGVASLKITPSSTDNSGAYTAYSLTAHDYTWSVDILGVAGITYEVHYANSSGTTLSVIETVVGTGNWQRIEGTFNESTSATRRIYIKKRGSGTAAFWIDGVQLEALSYSTSYCDGDQEGCQWTGGKHVSTSQRSAMYRGGGKKVSFESLGAYLISQQGTGMAPIENQRVPYAIRPGSYFQRSNVKERSITLAFSVAGDGVSGWHTRRQVIENLIKPDLVIPEQPFRIIYDGGGKEIYLDCYYEDGLGIADGVRDIEAIPIKCLSTDPFWKVDGNSAAALSAQSTFTSQYIIKRSPTGVWSTLSGTDANGSIYAIKAGIDGKIYIGGAFTSLNGVTGTSKIGYYDPIDGAYHRMGTYTGSYPHDIAIGANGDVYVVANDGVFKWNGSSWSNLTPSGAPGTDGAYAIAIGSDGTIYVGGGFSSINGVSISGVAKYNGSTWSSTSFASTCLDLAAASDGTIYAVGNTAPTSYYVYKYTGSAWVKVGEYFNSSIKGLAISDSGLLYAAGSFTVVSGSFAANYIAWSNGTSWFGLADGLPSAVSSYDNNSNAISVDANGYVYVGTWGDSTTPNGLMIWNGSTWLYSDLSLPGTSGTTFIYSVETARDGTLYLGFNTSGTSKTSGLTTITNGGSSKSYPTIVVNGPSSGTARLYRVFNATTGKVVYINYTMFVGEVITLSFGQSKTTMTSSMRGNISSAILPGSRTTDFALMSGQNAIGVFSDSSTVTTSIIWQETSWSIDSSAT